MRAPKEELGSQAQAKLESDLLQQTIKAAFKDLWVGGAREPRDAGARDNRDGGPQTRSTPSAR